MITSHLRVLALMLAVTAVEPAAAQMPMSSSLIHTVSVTVPPQVRVQVKNLPGAGMASQAAGPASGMSLSVTATQGWVLAIEARGNQASRRAEWSRQNGHGFRAIAESGTVIARGRIAAAPVAANLFVRSKKGVASDPILLTVTSP
jgi:hypothetical protein